eukprot:383946-Prymnesium_polylepis.1
MVTLQSPGVEVHPWPLFSAAPEASTVMSTPPHEVDATLCVETFISNPGVPHKIEVACAAAAIDTSTSQSAGLASAGDAHTTSPAGELLMMVHRSPHTDTLVSPTVPNPAPLIVSIWPPARLLFVGVRPASVSACVTTTSLTAEARPQPTRVSCTRCVPAARGDDREQPRDEPLSLCPVGMQAVVPIRISCADNPAVVAKFVPERSSARPTRDAPVRVGVLATEYSNVQPDTQSAVSLAWVRTMAVADTLLAAEAPVTQVAVV